MEDTEIMNLWNSYNKKLDEHLSLSRQNAVEITGLKVQSFINSMKAIKIFTLLTGVLWVAFVDFLLINLWHIANPFFLMSAIIQVILTKAAIIIYLYQLVLIYRVDCSDPILQTQEKLSRLKSTTVWVARLLFLQLPVWTTFYLTESMLMHGNAGWLIVQTSVTLLFLITAIWLFINIRPSNRHKKWFRLIFDGKEWTPLMKSMDLLEQIDEYADRKQ